MNNEIQPLSDDLVARWLRDQLEIEDDDEQEIEVSPCEDLVAKYQLFQQSTGARTDVIYHPCSGGDNSPSIAFPNSRVIYVEINKDAVEALQKAGLEAHHASALEYDPGEVDGLIMINPEISPDMPAHYVSSKGYAVVNNYHGTASRLRSNEDFQFVSIIRYDPGKGLLYDTQQLADCWQEVETEGEWRDAQFTWGGANYETAAQVVEAVTGKQENVLQEYRRLLNQARVQHGELMKELQEEHSESLELITKSEKDIYVYNHGGRQFVLQSNLPKKKGTVDDLFIFKKK